MQRSPIPISSATLPTGTKHGWTREEPRNDENRELLAQDPAPLELLRRDAAAGRLDLDPLLARVTESARALTGASGAALALWSQGLFICRARSGDPAPELGAKLSPDSGLSGECLRSAEPVRCDDTATDSRVDADVCQELGLRSLLAVPLLGSNGVLGLLEVFSGRPHAFATTDVDVLQQLAEIVVTGREGASTSVASPDPPVAVSGLAKKPEKRKAASPAEIVKRFQPAQKFIAWLLREEGQRTRLAVLGLVAAAILTWLGWVLSRPDGAMGRHNRSQAPVTASAMINPTPVPLDGSNPNTDSITNKPDPRQATTLEITALNVVHRAAKVQPLSKGDGGPQPAATDHALPARIPAEEAVAPPPSEILTGSSTDPVQSLGGVLAKSAEIPRNSVRVSQGVVPGVLIRKVMPVYPNDAPRQAGKQTVVLDFVIDEQGRVQNIKLVSGAPLFSRAAQTAVSQWKYRPYQLNGQPVPMDTTVSINFSAP
jgi:protein TonB